MTITSIDPITGENPFGQANSIIFATIRDHGSDIGEASTAVLSTYYPSPVDRTVRTTEALYAAAKAAAPGDARDAFAVACAQHADFCVANQFHELGQSDRGLKMSGACRRLVGLGSQDEADDPAVLPDFT